MAEIKKTITGDLFKYFCEHEVKGTEEEIFSAWVSQSTEMPEAEDLPICFQMIRNMTTSDSRIERRIWKFSNFPTILEAVRLRYSLFPYIYTMARTQSSLPR